MRLAPSNLGVRICFEFRISHFAQYSIADIALYAYTHVAGEGGFDLGRFPAVHAWLERVRSQPGHTPISQE
jgi:glutathione S-transferase